MDSSTVAEKDIRLISPACADVVRHWRLSSFDDVIKHPDYYILPGSPSGTHV